MDEGITFLKDTDRSFDLFRRQGYFQDKYFLFPCVTKYLQIEQNENEIRPCPDRESNFTINTIQITGILDRRDFIYHPSTTSCEN